MGVELVLRGVSGQDLARLAANPDLVGTFEAYTDTFDLHKDFEALQFVLKGDGPWEPTEPADVSPQYWLMHGGQYIMSDDVEAFLDDAMEGDAPVRAFDPSEVRRWDEFLATLTEDEIRSRFDPKAMAAVGVRVRSKRSAGVVSEEGPEYVVEAFRELRQFIGRRAASAEGVAIQMFI